MFEAVRIADLYYSTEPSIAVVGGPLCRGYELCLAGNIVEGRTAIQMFLARVFVSRQTENSTFTFVHQICAARGLPKYRDRASVPPEIVIQAAGRRFDVFHWPLLKSIKENGYQPDQGPPVTLRRVDGRLLLGDGKNRTSILAALGREELPKWRYE
jgi:hypothetical protein